jgi:methyl-accepting chemotaxis protein
MTMDHKEEAQMVGDALQVMGDRLGEVIEKGIHRASIRQDEGLAQLDATLDDLSKGIHAIASALNRIADTMGGNNSR